MKHHTTRAAALLAALGLAAAPAPAAPCPSGWQGEYEWSESEEHPSGEMYMVWSYHIRIAEEQGHCQARLTGDGHMLEMRILADVQGDAQAIRLLYREALPDAGTGSFHERGAELLRLERRGQELLTHWGAMSPNADDAKSGVRFTRKRQASVSDPTGTPAGVRAAPGGSAEKAPRAEAPNPTGHTQVNLPRSRCPNKLIRKGVFQGAYTGADCGDYCYAHFRLPSGETAHLGCIMEPEQLEQRYGGEHREQMRDIPYVTMQWWIPEGDFCSHSPMCAEAPLAWLPSDTKKPAAQDAGAFSPAELKLMSTFVSNFTEVRFPNFDMKKSGDADTLHLGDDPSNPALVYFGIWHNYINNYKSRIKPCAEKDCTHGQLVMDAKFAAESVKKYFDIELKHRSVPRTDDWLSCHFDGTRYHFDGADGELVSYAKVKRAVREGDIIRMSGDLYQEDTNDIVGSFVVTAKPHKWNGKDTWAILSLKRERR